MNCLTRSLEDIDEDLERISRSLHESSLDGFRNLVAMANLELIQIRKTWKERLGSYLESLNKCFPLILFVLGLLFWLVLGRVPPFLH